MDVSLRLSRVVCPTQLVTHESLVWSSDFCFRSINQRFCGSRKQCVVSKQRSTVAVARLFVCFVLIYFCCSYCLQYATGAVFGLHLLIDDWCSVSGRFRPDDQIIEVWPTDRSIQPWSLVWSLVWSLQVVSCFLLWQETHRRRLWLPQISAHLVVDNFLHSSSASSSSWLLSWV